ncbi:putative aquaporin NIP5-1 [Wolffia australiana]
MTNEERERSEEKSREGTPHAHSFVTGMVTHSPEREGNLNLQISAPGRINPSFSFNSKFSDFKIVDISLRKKFTAELVGTFIIVFGGAAAPIVNQKYEGVEGLLGSAAAAGLAVMIAVLSTGHISGAHLNPSVTLAFAIFRHFPWIQVPVYLAAQVSGAISAAFALKRVFQPFQSGGVTTPSIDSADAFLLEFLVTFFLMFVITAVATDTRAVGELAGIAIGGTVALDVLVAGPSTGASMNPVRTLGPAIATGNFDHLWIYLLAPPAGAVVGAAAYTIIKLTEEESQPRRQTRTFGR